MAQYRPHLIAVTTTLAANASQQLQASVSGGTFFLEGVLVKSTGAFNMNLQPTDTQKDLATVRLPEVFWGRIDNGAGVQTEAKLARIDGGAASKIQSPLEIRDNSIVTVDLVDTSAVANTIWICLVGRQRSG